MHLNWYFSLLSQWVVHRTDGVFEIRFGRRAKKKVVLGCICDTNRHNHISCRQIKRILSSTWIEGRGKGEGSFLGSFCVNGSTTWWMRLKPEFDCKILLFDLRTCNMDCLLFLITILAPNNCNRNLIRSSVMENRNWCVTLWYAHRLSGPC